VLGPGLTALACTALVSLLPPLLRPLEAALAESSLGPTVAVALGPFLRVARLIGPLLGGLAMVRACLPPAGSEATLQAWRSAVGRRAMRRGIGAHARTWGQPTFGLLVGGTLGSLLGATLAGSPNSLAMIWGLGTLTAAAALSVGAQHMMGEGPPPPVRLEW
jgi:hypothetical protein